MWNFGEGGIQVIQLHEFHRLWLLCPLELLWWWLMCILKICWIWPIQVLIILYSCSVFIVRNGSLRNMLTFTSCVFTFYADHFPSSPQFPVPQRRLRQFNVKYGQKFHLPVLILCGCLQLTLNCHKEGPLAPVHHTDPPNIMSHEWLLKLTKCSAEFESTMPRFILSTVKYFLLSREV